MTVLDASAVLAWLKDEPGATVVQMALDQGEAVISAVNLAEVLALLSDTPVDLDALVEDLERSGLSVAAFQTADALMGAALRPFTHPAGLALGDRACLALGQRLGRPVLTADRAWATLDLPVTVHVLR